LVLIWAIRKVFLEEVKFEICLERQGRFEGGRKERA
jgi:hypothetical protein